MAAFRSLLVAVLLASAWLGIGGPVYADGAGIEGLWSLEDVIFDACPTGNSVRTVFDMKMFLHDGSMIETSGTPGVGAPPLQRGTPGLGSWRHVTDHHYAATFRFFRYNGSDDSFAGTQTASVDIELSRDGKTLTTATTTDIFDANGTLIATRCTAGTGTRVE